MKHNSTGQNFFADVHASIGTVENEAGFPYKIFRKFGGGLFGKNSEAGGGGGGEIALEKMNEAEASRGVELFFEEGVDRVEVVPFSVGFVANGQGDDPSPAQDFVKTRIGDVFVYFGKGKKGASGGGGFFAVFVGDGLIFAEVREGFGNGVAGDENGIVWWGRVEIGEQFGKRIEDVLGVGIGGI